MKRIFITGCARSGTTLLCRLFYSFKKVKIFDKEIFLSRFVERTSKGIVIGKRAAKTIFSCGSHVEWVRKEQNIATIKNRDIKVVNIFRDGRDVIESLQGDACDAWITCIKEMEKYSSLISCLVQYEKLLAEPDSTQKHIAEVLGLEIKYKFSEYPIFVPNSAGAHIKDGAYRKRPLSYNRVGKDLGLYKVKCKNLIVKFEECLKYTGYL